MRFKIKDESLSTSNEAQTNGGRLNGGRWRCARKKIEADEQQSFQDSRLPSHYVYVYKETILYC